MEVGTYLASLHNSQVGFGSLKPNSKGESLMSDVQHHKQKTRPYVSRKLPPLKPKRPLLIVFALTCLGVAVIVFVVYPDSRIELFAVLVSAAIDWLKDR